MKLFLCLLLVGLVASSPAIERENLSIQGLPIEGRSAPGVKQPLSEAEEYHYIHEESSNAHSLVTHDEYGLPVFHEEYGVPHEEYNVPVVPTLKSEPPVTEHYCPEEDFVQDFVAAPPSPPEIVPLPDIPIVKYEIPVGYDEYIVPEVPHDEYGPPVKVPLCPNGALDTTYPFCCENGATNPFCCTGIWINPTCSEPTTTTTVPAPLCPNGALDSTYPFCCENGGTNPFCCTGEWINPTCSEPKVEKVPEVIAPYPAKIIEDKTEVFAPYPAKRLCVNGAQDTTYPFCCENGATNEYCCTGVWVNPTCSETTTTTTVPTPLCPNGAPDVAYPFCCENGASNPFCCTGEWINPTCSEPKVIEVTEVIAPYPPKVIEVVPEVIAPYPAKKLCLNDAQDFTYPFCCENGATNEYCCTGVWVNPTCSEPTTTTTKPAPLCPNGALDSTYPFCCENGGTNPYCCTGEWINPTCSEPKVEKVPEVIAPYPAKVIEEVSEVFAPYPAKKLCVNGAQDKTYPFCCENGATNEYCCTGVYVNPTCSEPTTTTTKPAPLCPNGALDSTYPFCCENGGTNPFCCTGEWINPTCSEPKVIAPYPAKVIEEVHEVIAPYPAKIIEEKTEVIAPYPAKRLCVNGAQDTTYPFCCENGATNEYCCTGVWVNPTCSEPTTTTTTTPVPPTVKLAPYPAPTKPVPIVAKSPYAGKVHSKYEDSHLRGDIGIKKDITGVTTGGFGEGIIDVRVPETKGIKTVGVITGTTKTKVVGGEIRGRSAAHGSINVRTHTGGARSTGRIVGGTVGNTKRSANVVGRGSGGGTVSRTQVRSGGTIIRGRSGISGRSRSIIRSTPVRTVVYNPLTVRGLITGRF